MASSNVSRAEEAPSSSSPSSAAALGVRQLLELERQIYQESIDRVAAQREQLRGGALDEFVLRCLPFETERERELESAMAQLQLNKRNGLDLLEFELQAAEDVFRDERRQLRQRLLDQATRRLKKLERRRRALDAANAQKKGADRLAYRPAFVQRLKKEREREERKKERNRALPSRVDAEALEKELARVQRDAQHAFNFRHMRFAVPPPARIVRDVTETLGAFEKRVEIVDGALTLSRKMLGDDIERKVLVQGDGKRLVCSTIDWATNKTQSATFRVDDVVILVSHLSEEEFHGQVVGFSQQQVQLELVCGSHVTVDVDRLRDGRCSLRHLASPSSGAQTDNAVVDELRASPSVRRRAAMEMSRRRRKTTVDIRRGF